MNNLHQRVLIVLAAVLVSLTTAVPAWTYPPGVGILAKNRSCTACHISNGPWADEARTIIDVLDAQTKRSLKAPDGVFRIDVPRGEARTVLTAIGRTRGDATPPRRNAWLYVDPSQIASSTLSKFAPGWDVNLPMSCRIVGDSLEGRDDALVTVLPMTLRPTDAARDAEIELQIMLTTGEAVKDKGREGLVSNYFVRKVLLRVLERQ
jgi:hypothetical protein